MRILQTLAHPSLRSLLEPRLHASQLVYPVFLKSDIDDSFLTQRKPKEPLDPFRQMNPESPHFLSHINHLHSLGLRHLMLFGVVNRKIKDVPGSSADSPENPVIYALRKIRTAPELNTLALWADVCLCEYTESGHCGVLNENCSKTHDGQDSEIANEASVKRLGQIAHAYASAGADVVCPSDMRDGRVAEVRQSVPDTVQICAYTSKKASSLYAPFRGAVESEFKGERTRYQHPVGSAATALRAAARDVKEGADMLLVKPALFYGDVIREFKSLYPDRMVVAYMVSGEYVMLRDYGRMTGTEDSILKEAHLSVKRAGADVIITYFAAELLEKGSLEKW
jgi:porphobilinogen synthase